MTVALPINPDVLSTVRTDVLVIGAGPAGLSAAAELCRRGVSDVLVVDRDTVAGGMPRWCGHSPFGMREYSCILSGPVYGDRLASTALALGARISLRHSAVSIGVDGAVICATPEGVKRIEAERIIVATGIREKSRAARLIPGERPPTGIINTGALQYFVYRDGQPLPFRNPVIVGTELVSMSSLLTLRSAGIRPVAVIEKADRPVVRAPFAWLPTVLGVPMHFSSEIEAVEGHPHVTAVVIRTAGKSQRIACDGIVLTGDFTPESSLLRMSGIAIDSASGGPVIDSDGRTSDARVFAVGNVLRGVETAGWCWSEGRALARFVVQDLIQPATHDTVTIDLGADIRHAVPQKVLPDGAVHEMIQLRLSRPIQGRLVVEADGRILWSRALDSRTERRILVPIREIVRPSGCTRMTIRAEGKSP